MSTPDLIVNILGPINYYEPRLLREAMLLHSTLMILEGLGRAWKVLINSSETVYSGSQI